MNYEVLTDEDVKTALAEVRQLRADFEELRVKREAVLAAIEEVDELQDSVHTSARKIKEHLKQAL